VQARSRRHPLTRSSLQQPFGDVPHRRSAPHVQIRLLLALEHLLRTGAEAGIELQIYGGPGVGHLWIAAQDERAIKFRQRAQCTFLQVGSSSGLCFHVIPCGRSSAKLQYLQTLQA